MKCCNANWLVSLQHVAVLWYDVSCLACRCYLLTGHETWLELFIVWTLLLISSEIICPTVPTIIMAVNCTNWSCSPGSHAKSNLTWGKYSGPGDGHLLLEPWKKRKRVAGIYVLKRLGRCILSDVTGHGIHGWVSYDDVYNADTPIGNALHHQTTNLWTRWINGSGLKR